MSENPRTWVGRVISQAKRAVQASRSRFLRGDRQENLPAPSTPAVQVQRWQNHPMAAKLVASGTFSAEFYRRVTGKPFADDREAAAHYLSFRMKMLVPPNPFIEIQSVPDAVRKAMRRANAGPLIDYLTATEPVNPGPAIDASLLTRSEDSHEQGSSDGLSPLGIFLTTMTESTELPVSPDSPLSGALALRYADQVTEYAEQLFAEQTHRPPSIVSDWDWEAEESWKADLSQFELKQIPLVSIIMPVTDQANRIREAVASIQGQTYGSWELIFVHSNSSSDSRAFADQLAASNPRIVVLENAGHGVSAARNSAVRVANGQYLAFLKPDSVWAPDYLSCMVRAMVRDDLSWANATIRILQGEETAYQTFAMSRDDQFSGIDGDLNTTVATYGFLKELGGFDESLLYSEDFDLVLRMSEAASPTHVPFVGGEKLRPDESTDGYTAKETARWQWVALGKSLIDWDSEKEKRVPGRVSVIILAEQDLRRIIETVDSVLKDGGFDDAEILVVDNGLDDDVALALVQNMPARDEVKLVRLTRPLTFALANNYAFLESTGEYVMFLNGSTRVRQGSLQRLVLELADESVAGAQPLLTYNDDTILSAGTVWTSSGPAPVRLFEQHPLEDASAIDGHQFAAAHGAALLMRAGDFYEVRGFDHSYVAGMDDTDLSLRALQRRSGGFRVVRETIVACIDAQRTLRDRDPSGNRRVFVERWQGRLPTPDFEIFTRSGFKISPEQDADLQGKSKETAVMLERIPSSGMRWGIKNPAKAGVLGDRWGDTHFIDSLANSLKSLGQSVVTYRQPAHKSPATALDDVSLVIRGLKESHPIPGIVNVLWIISHPDDVTAAEIAGFDLVYAASTSWARWATEEFGVEVRPLLQATDSTRFNYKPVPENPSTDVVFVGGRFKTRRRTAVGDALESGVRFKIFGPRWDGVIPEQVFAGKYVPNEALAEVYRDARFVLADHWDLMAREGFIQNRIFDAVASGCLVISDEVKDLHVTFGEEVLVSHGPDDIKRYVEKALTEDAQLAQNGRYAASQRVLKNHSFDARAEQLLADVEEWKAKNHL